MSDRAFMAYDIENQIADTEGKTAGKIYEREIDITTAELLALSTTPKELVAAPGLGIVLEFVSLVSFLDYNSIDYATYGDLTVHSHTSGTAVSATIGASDLLQASADAYNVTQVLSADVVLNDNEALELRVGTGNPTAGNSPLKVRIAYRIHDFN